MKFTADDERFMRRALALAARGEGRVEPNPMVGCVLVRGGQIIGEGYHPLYGGPHAEPQALQSATIDPRGCTAYVTLEPCNYVGKTPACTSALIAARISRVVIGAARDANPRVSGRGLALLRKHGIQVAEGLCEAEALALLAPYNKLVKCGRPWVTLKWGQSLDGKLATRTGDAKWITDDVQRQHANRERGRFDSIIVGVGTVLADNPQLTCRSTRPKRVAARIVVDTHLRTPLTATLVASARETPTWFYCGSRASAVRRQRLERAGCRVHAVATSTASGGIDLDALLARLGEARMTNVLVEGGGRLLGAFVDVGLADEVNIYVAPVLIGGREAVGALHGIGAAKLADAVRLPSGAESLALRRMGSGWFIQARLTGRQA